LITTSRRIKGIFAKPVLTEMGGSTPLLQLLEEMPQELVQNLDPFNVTRAIGYKTLTSYIIPAHGDRPEMAHGLECRTPFMERDLVEYACQLPEHYFIKMDQLREKHLLREALADVLPPFMRNSHKKPFQAPS